MCDVAVDTDVSFHMLSQKVGGSKIKKQNSQRDQTQKFIENFIFFLPFLFFMFYGMTSSSSYTAHTWFSPKESSIQSPSKSWKSRSGTFMETETFASESTEIDLFSFSESTISFGPGFTPLISFSLSFTLTSAIAFFDIEIKYHSSSFLRISFHSSKFIQLSFHSSSFLRISFRAFSAKIS